eukprot:TRINITY_DN38617_c0_g1_i2.p1 TRINITY_DN38617_c0_g1~~TRINITY_DN38617_c0_g1_i2.p1  ORF type:complete len:225 (+),score=17.05 TRINITY_DN38617_c0_g1_i2:58-675(+)
MHDSRHRGRYTGSDTSSRKGGFRGTAENAKTQVCTRWKAGDCRFGDRCNFAHGEHELRRLPPRQGRGTAGRSAAAGRGHPTRAQPRYTDTYLHQNGAVRAHHMTGLADTSASLNTALPINTPLGQNAAGYGMNGTSASALGSSPSGLYGSSPGSNSENAWAACGFPLAGANGWIMYRVPESGEPYFHNAKRGITQWEQPPDFIEV